MASSGEDTKRAELELEKRRADAVLTACNLGLKEELERLLAEGATFSCRDKRGTTPLFFAASRGHADVIDLLCAHGVDSNDDDALGRTPLHAAAAHDRADAVHALMRRDAWIEAPDHADDTPLHLAARMAGRLTVEALLGHGAKVDAVNKLGLTPLCEAAVVRERFDVADALVRGGASPSSERVNGYALVHVAAAMNRTRALEWLRTHDDAAKDDESFDGTEGVPGGMTPLHCAAAAGATGAAAALLAAAPVGTGWDAASTDADGRTAAEVMREGRGGEGVDRDAREVAAKEIERAARRTSRTKGGAAGEELSFSALDAAAQRTRVIEWDAVRPEDRTKRRVPPAAWRALDARAELTRQADLCDFLQKLVDDADFQADMKTPRVRPAVEEVIQNFHNVTKWRDDATVMGVLNKFRHVQRYCKEAGVRIRFEDVVVRDAADADERRGRVATMREAANGALERAREDVLAFESDRMSSKESRECVSGGASEGVVSAVERSVGFDGRVLALALAAIAAVILAAAVQLLGSPRLSVDTL